MVLSPAIASWVSTEKKLEVTYLEIMILILLLLLLFLTIIDISRIYNYMYVYIYIHMFKYRYYILFLPLFRPIRIRDRVAFRVAYDGEPHQVVEFAKYELVGYCGWKKSCY